VVIHRDRIGERLAGPSVTATRGLRIVAAALAALVALIHFVEAPEYLERQPYLGVLFVVGGLALVLVAVQLARRLDAIAGAVGALVMAGMFVGGILSRTVGLPGFREPDWETLLVASLVLEAAYLMLFAVSTTRARR
jgi:hypothetical protein